MTASPDQHDLEPRNGSNFGIRTLADPRRPFSRLAAALMVSSIGDPFSLAVSLVLLYDSFHTPFAIAGAYGARAIAALVVGGLAGSITDRVDRRQLLVALDAGRLLVLLVLPFLVPSLPAIVYPALLLLGGAEALAQPARLAGAVVLAPAGAVDRANSLLMVSFSVAQAIGFALAGLAITLLPHPSQVFWIDAATFLCSVLLVLTLPNLGGGIVTAKFRLSGLQQLRRRSLRPLLLVTGGANLMIGVGTAAVLPLAYVLVTRDAAAAYTWLEVAVIVGLVVGSLILSRRGRGHAPVGMAVGVGLFGLGALGIALVPLLAVALAGFVLTGIANAVYSVRNRTALMEAAGAEEQGAVMSTRYSIAQASQIVGLGAGALVTALATPRGAFGVVAVGMLAVTAAITLHLRRPRRRAGGDGDPEP